MGVKENFDKNTTLVFGASSAGRLVLSHCADHGDVSRQELLPKFVRGKEVVTCDLAPAPQSDDGDGGIKSSTTCNSSLFSRLPTILFGFSM